MPDLSVGGRQIVVADLLLNDLQGRSFIRQLVGVPVAQAMAWNVNAFGYVRVQVSPNDYERARTFLLELSESAEPGASPNGGLATPPGSSGAKEGPPSES